MLRGRSSRVSFILVRRHNPTSKPEGIIGFLRLIYATMTLFFGHEQGLMRLVVFVETPTLDLRQELPVAVTILARPGRVRDGVDLRCLESKLVAESFRNLRTSAVVMDVKLFNPSPHRFPI